jgi:hypothetical protein
VGQWAKGLCAETVLRIAFLAEKTSRIEDCHTYPILSPARRR